MNLNRSRNSGLLSWVLSVESGISGFEEENPPSDLPKSIFGGGDPSPTVTDVKSADFRVSSGGLGKWVGSQVTMDTHSCFFSLFIHTFLLLYAIFFYFCFTLRCLNGFCLKCFKNTGCQNLSYHELSSCKVFQEFVLGLDFIVFNK